MNREVATPAARSTTRDSLALAVGAALVASWPFVLSTFGKDDVYRFMGPYGLFVIIVTLLLKRLEPMPPRSWRFRLRDAGLGVAVGVVMTLGTYGAYALYERVVPGLSLHVSKLYAMARTQPLQRALAWTVVVIVAEELLWRGALLVTLEHRFGRSVAVLLSLGSYAFAQSGSGSAVVVLAAIVCGAIWTATRIFTSSSLAPLVSHMIWTLTVIHLFPVTRI